VTDHDTMAAVKENFRSHASHLHPVVPGALRVRRGAVEIVDSHLDHDTFNLMYLATTDGVLTTADAQACGGYALRAGRPYSFWALGSQQIAVAQRLLPSAGFAEAESERVMVANFDGSYCDEVDSRLVVEVAATEAVVREYAEVLAASWSPPAEPVADFLSEAAGHLASGASRSQLLVGRVDGRVVCGAEVHFAAGLAGVYGVATLESHRGMGFGGKVMSRVVELSVRRGVLRGCLQATEDGAGLYKRLGFQQVEDCQEFAIG
jgi:GNAT superfamily N-acetyltransferase